MNFFGDNRWLVFVMPGFLALFVAMFVSDLPEIRDAFLPIIYVALTFLSVALPLGALHVYGKFRDKTYTLESALRIPSVLISIFTCSILIGLAFGIANTTDVVSQILRAAFGNDNVIVVSHSELNRLLFRNAGTDAFPDRQPHIEMQNHNLYVRFTFKGERATYEGSIGQYYGTGDKPQIYISPACRIEEGKMSLVQGPGAWLDLEEAEDIQFIYSSCSECAKMLELQAGKPAPKSCPFDQARSEGKWSVSFSARFDLSGDLP